METLLEIPRILQVALGIGLVIFVHESGHYFAARMCGVRVDVFSIGFGPRVFGWKRGATQYQLAAIPFGGYVRMAGEEPPGYRDPDHEPRSWELASKTPAQRFFIYSGGVLMNVAFGLVVFPIVLMAGVPSWEPVVGEVLGGSPAWRQRIEPGTRILRINGKDLFDFMYVAQDVALGGAEPAVIECLPPGSDEVRTVTVRPDYDEADGYYTIGVRPARNLAGEITVWGTPARDAGLETGDRLVDVAGAVPGLAPYEKLQWARAVRGPIEVTVERDGERIKRTVEPVPAEQFKGRKFGIGYMTDVVGALRPNPALAELDLRVGDRLIEACGVVLERPEDLLRALVASEGAVALAVEREGERLELSGPALDDAGALALWRDVFLDKDDARWRALVTPGSAADAAGLRTGDRIVGFDGADVGPYMQFFDMAGAATRVGRAATLTVSRMADDGPASFELEIQPEEFSPMDYGFDVPLAEYTYQAASVGEAIRAGFASSWRFVAEAGITLRKITSGEVRSDNLGGIISIGKISHSWASRGWAKLFFFLCILSLNLAFLNVLPIPVLDGGHLFFILIEMIKGSPVSERTLGYSQIVGLVLIVSLMVYVTYNDVMRWFFNG